MSGRKGRSGRKPLTVREHMLRGTYVPARHGPLNVLNMPTAPIPSGPSIDWQPTASQRHALGARGRAFLDARLGNYAISPAESDIVLLAARAADEADLWRRRARRWKDPVAAVRAGRLQLLHERAFLQALALLKETK